MAGGRAVAGFAGAVLIFSPWQTASELFSLGGLECLAASVSYAISYIYMDRFLARRGIERDRAVSMPAGRRRRDACRCPRFHRRANPQVTTEDIAALAVLGIIGTGFAYVLNYQIITSDGATAASMVTYLLPVVAIVLGVLVLNESITAIVLGGIALVLTGVALTRRKPNKSSETSRD